MPMVPVSKRIVSHEHVHVDPDVVDGLGRKFYAPAAAGQYVLVKSSASSRKLRGATGH